MAKVKRSEILTYIDIDGAEDYALIGVGVVDASIAMNPTVSDEHYIHLDAASKAVEGYAPEMPVEATANNTDAVFEYVDNLRKTQAILEDAETTICNVWDYETGGPTAAPANQIAVAVAIDSFGGPGGEAGKINYTLHYIGDPIPGTFNTTTEAFTAT